MGKSKRGGVFGLIRGSVGPATYSVGKDSEGKKQQIVREKPTEVANPRTRAQAIQRLKMKPIFFMRMLLSTIVDHSFKGVPNGQASLQHFVSLAMKEFDVPYLQKNSMDKAVGGYQISEGDIANLKAVLAPCTSALELNYSKDVPSVRAFDFSGIMGVDGTPRNDIKGWGAVSQAILDKNKWLNKGDEIAVLLFVHTIAGQQHGVELVKVRVLLDPDFTTNTPENFIYTSGERTIDCNALYAFSLYNPDIDFSSLSGVDAYSGTVDVSSFKSLLGIVSFDSDNNLWGFVGPHIVNGAVDVPGNGFNVVPQSAQDAAGNYSIAAVSVIVSRKEGDVWNFSTSDICLTSGYVKLFNSDIRLESAIASYMSEPGSNSALSDKFLHLTASDEDAAVASFNISALPTGGSLTNYSVIGAVGLETETKYVFTRTAGNQEYILDMAGGTIITATVNEETVKITPAMVRTAGIDFVDESDVAYL